MGIRFFLGLIFHLPVVGPSYIISATNYTWQEDVVFGNLMKTNTIVTDSNYNSLFLGERVGEILAQKQAGMLDTVVAVRGGTGGITSDLVYRYQI